MPETPFFAHSGNDQSATRADWQPLNQHLRAVAQGAEARAREACPGQPTLAAAARLAGLLHDLGKYRDEFQRYIRGILTDKRSTTFHKQAGSAQAASEKHGLVAFAIAGHHGGMPALDACQKICRSDSNGKPVATKVWPTAVADCPELAFHPAVLNPQDALLYDLWTRVIFSCLVDADWADTGRHQREVVRGLPPEPPAPDLQPAQRLQCLLIAIRERAATCLDPDMARVRDEVLRACLAAADQAPGLFTLTVPTGGGKTLSALAFALQHAVRHGLRRVIYVAPYLSILDQNARVIRRVLGVLRDAVDIFEHHSLAEPLGDTEPEELGLHSAARRAENWDSPIILTTNVQFFESLFSNRPGRCRKLHNIARSVVLLDECQSLPPGLVLPVCGMLRQLTEHLGTTLVFCTATQPAFDHPTLQTARLSATEIAPPSLNLFHRLRRTRVEWPAAGQRLTWEEVANRMAEQAAGLCIVNTRKAARDLFAALKERRADGVFHLSTSMCPEHRLRVLDQVKLRLRKPGESCLLVSTQLIEAGVDVDFPCVYRELAPLEAIVQAAGRCNREGLLRFQDGTPGGRVVVFRSQEGRLPPDLWYREGQGIVERCFLNAGRQPSIDDPQHIRGYFERLYYSGNLDAEGVVPQRRQLNFPEVAQRVRLIDEDGVAVVVATWLEAGAEIQQLLDELQTQPTRAGYRRLARFQVNLRSYERAKAHQGLSEEAGVLVWRGVYDAEMGLEPRLSDEVLLA